MTEQMNEQNVQDKKDNDPEVECAANNREVRGSTPGDIGQSSPTKDARTTPDCYTTIKHLSRNQTTSGYVVNSAQ